MEKQELSQKPLKRKWWFRLLKRLMRVRYKRPKFIYLGEEITNGGVILSNHEGTDSPMCFEIYFNKRIRFWGTYQMNSGFIKMYKYQSRVYYHEKKHWSLFGARMFCLIATPLTYLFYKGLNLISTYPDARFTKTISESLESIKSGDNIVIFPEKSPDGYQDTLQGFYGGFALFASACAKKGIDIPIFTSYYNKKKGVYMIDEPILYSTLVNQYPDREELSKALCERCNQLGVISNKEDFNV